jgi:hypothetical protein
MVVPKEFVLSRCWHQQIFLPLFGGYQSLSSVLCWWSIEIETCLVKSIMFMVGIQMLSSASCSCARLLPENNQLTLVR